MIQQAWLERRGLEVDASDVKVVGKITLQVAIRSFILKPQTFLVLASGQHVGVPACYIDC